MGYIRAHIRLNSAREANDFVSKMNHDGTADRYIIEDYNGIERANARSLFGVIYALSDYAEQMFLVNETDDGNFPSFIDEYRVIGQ